MTMTLQTMPHSGQAMRRDVKISYGILPGTIVSMDGMEDGMEGGMILGIIALGMAGMILSMIHGIMVGVAAGMILGSLGAMVGVIHIVMATWDTEDTMAGAIHTTITHMVEVADTIPMAIQVLRITDISVSMVHVGFLTDVPQYTVQELSEVHA